MAPVSFKWSIKTYATISSPLCWEEQIKKNVWGNSVISLCLEEDGDVVEDFSWGGLSKNMQISRFFDSQMHFPVIWTQKKNLKIFPYHGGIYSFGRKFNKNSGKKDDVLRGL